MSRPHADSDRLGTNDAVHERFPDPEFNGRRRVISPPGRLFRFLVLSLTKAHDDEIPTQSAALAFLTIIAIVPLLAGLSYFSAGFFADRQDELVQLLSQVLPYTEANITDRLTDFLKQSRQLRGLAFFAFLVTALSAFIAIESSINDIWNVTARRSLRTRISSFVQLLLFGPILIVGTYSLVFYLDQQPAFQQVQESFTAQALVKGVPTLVTALGLTFLYWQVPNTRVRFRSALGGGVLAALLIELLRWGFGYYVDMSQRISAVYGSFGLLLLFIISIQLTWAIVLLGTEIAYCTQNFHYMSRKRLDTAVMDGAWLGLATLLLVLERFREKHPITPHELLAERLRLSVVELRQAIRPLVQAELLRENLGEANGYLLSCDPYRVPVSEIFELYEEHQWRLMETAPSGSRADLADLRKHFIGCRNQVLGDITLSSLLTTQDAEAGTEAAAETGSADEPPGEADG